MRLHVVVFRVPTTEIKIKNIKIIDEKKKWNLKMFNPKRRKREKRNIKQVGQIENK